MSEVDQAHNARERIEDALYNLKYKEDAARSIGLKDLADELRFSIKEIETGTKELYDAFSETVRQRFHHAQESSANMLRLGMHMGKIQEETP